MKKLRIALTVLFALCCSLFLFACGGGNTSGVRRVGVSGAQTSFKEGEDFSSEGLVVEVTYKDGEVKELTAEEYEVDSSAYKKDVAGTYTIIVTPNGQTDVATPVTGTYEVTVDHAFANQDGKEICSVCGAEREIHALDDTIVTAAWDETATLTKGENSDSPAVVAAGEDYVSYGQLSIGQSATLVGEITAVDTAASWNTPLIGIRSGSQGYITREDNWIIGTSPNGTFKWDFADGAAKSGARPADSADWDVYNVSSLTWTASQIAPAAGSTTAFTVVFNYREDGVMEIRHITPIGSIIYETKVPASTYDLVVYGEKVTMHFTELTIIRNLVMEKFEITSQPDKVAYAEHNMFDLTGLETKATYNRNVTTPITTYSILADITTKDKEGKDVTTSYDLRKTPLSAEMKNFRVEFGGVSIPLNGITVTESLFDKANGDYDFTFGGATFFGDDAVYSYDVNADKEITISVTGKANALTAEQKTALGTTKAYYIAFKLENAKDTAVATAVCSLADAKVTVDGKDVNVIVPVDDKTADFTVTAKDAADKALAEVNIDVSGLAIPEVASVQSGEAFVDKGGTFTITFTGAIPAKDVARIRVGTMGYKISDIEEGIADGKYKGTGLVEITGLTYGEDEVVVTLTMSAPDLTKTSNNYIGEYNIQLDNDGTIVAEETVRMTFEMADAAANGYIAVPGTNAYIKVNGTQFIVVSLAKTSDLQTSNIVTDLFVNFQNDTAATTEVGFGAVLSGTQYVAGKTAFNALMNSNTTRYTIVTIGTFNDATDRDHGVLTAVKADLTALGLRATEATETQAFGFEVVSGKVNGAAVAAQDEGKSLFFVVGANDAIETKQVNNSDYTQTTLQPLSCVTDEVKAYKYTIAQGNDFYFGRTIKEATGSHTWVAGEKGDTCSACGSFKSTGKANNTQVAKIEGVADTGLTVFFNVSGATGDWASPVINNSGLLITLPNLDPYNNTTNGLFPTGGNKFPAAENLFNGGTWDSFLNRDCAVAIVISPSAGITYYRDGIKVVGYAAGDAVGDRTVADFANALLGLIEESGFMFGDGSGVGTVSELAYITTALNEEQVAVNAFNLGYTSSVRLGEADNSTGYTGTAPLWTGSIEKGQKVTITGTATSNGSGVWNSPLAYLWTGDTASLNFRADNWINPPDGGDQDKAPVFDFVFTKVWKGFDPESANGDDWVATLVNQYKAGEFATTITWDWTDASKIAVSYAFTWGAGEEAVTFNQTYEVKAAESKTLLDTYSIGVGVDGASIVMNQITVTTAPATPAE